MRLRLVFTRISFLVALIAPSAGSVFAQAPLEPTQLPSRTIFYLLWCGTPTGEVRKTNSLMSLWDDPDFAPVRTALANAMMSDAKSQKEKSSLSREELANFATLLDNPFTIGYIPREGAAPKPATPNAKPPAWNGMFLVYDRSGKEELLSKAVLRMRAGGEDIPTLTDITVAGVKALKVERKSGTNYWAETGKYAVSATEPAVFEEVLKRVTGKATGSSLAELAVYREQDWVIIAALDKGSGIASEILPRLFAPFERGGQNAGLGLGLALVERIARAHGGSAFANPRETGGALVGMRIARAS